MHFALGTIAVVTTLNGEATEICEFLAPSGEFQRGIQGAAVYDEKTAKKLARRNHCKTVPIHSEYVDRLNLVIQG